jgi:hypothetical protein
MRIKLDNSMIDFYQQQLEYATERQKEMRAVRDTYKAKAYMEDEPALVMTFVVRAELANDAYLFWTSQIASIRSKLN